jgi:hypothetical protein
MDITEKIRIKLKKSREAMNLSLDDVPAVSGLKKWNSAMRPVYLPAMLQA